MPRRQAEVEQMVRRPARVATFIVTFRCGRRLTIRAASPEAAVRLGRRVAGFSAGAKVESVKRLAG